MSELWKCFMFVDHTWLQVGFNEGKHLHFRSEFSKAPSSTSVLLLPQKPPVKPPSNDSSASFWEALPVHTANNTAWIMLLCTVCIGCICLARCLCSPHPSFIGSWDGTKEQTTETLLACSSLLLSLSGSCTAPAPLLSELINLMSLHAHEKFISFSGLVNLWCQCKRKDSQTTQLHTPLGGWELESVRGPTCKLGVRRPELPPHFATSPSASPWANHLLLLLSELLHIIAAFAKVKLKLSRTILLAAWQGTSGISLKCWGPHQRCSLLTGTYPNVTSETTQSKP